MARGKYLRTRPRVRSNPKLIALLLAVVLTVSSAVATGTVAWLVAESDKMVNTFTYGDIELELKETDTLDGDGNPNTNKYKMMPGQDISKDPTVTVKADSEANWLFVKLKKSENFDNFMTYIVADGWTQLYDADGNEVQGVYYRFQDGTTVDVSYPILSGNVVTVRETVTKEQLNALNENESNPTLPTLTITAYAVQYVGFEAAVSEGADTATDAQVNTAALAAWHVVEEPSNP